MAVNMICPKCGVGMNFHAEKLVYSESALDMDAALGGHVEEMHTCPRCGSTESCRERPPSSLGVSGTPSADN
jgi:ribosomal protein S27AE